jgi:predicted RNA-binding Zn-ribbon protein involved in translation (DUF1610 family)
MWNIINRLKDRIRKARSKDLETTAECWSCQNKMAFTVPRKGYSSSERRCPACGLEFIAISDHGRISLITYQEAAGSAVAAAEIVSRNWDSFSVKEQETFVKSLIKR